MHVTRRKRSRKWRRKKIASKSQRAQRTSRALPARAASRSRSHSGARILRAATWFTHRSFIIPIIHTIVPSRYVRPWFYSLRLLFVVVASRFTRTTLFEEMEKPILIEISRKCSFQKKYFFFLSAVIDVKTTLIVRGKFCQMKSRELLNRSCVNWRHQCFLMYMSFYWKAICLTCCAGNDARREYFCPKLQYSPGFKYIEI